MKTGAKAAPREEDRIGKLCWNGLGVRGVRGIQAHLLSWHRDSAWIDRMSQGPEAQIHLGALAKFILLPDKYMTNVL